LRNPMKPYSHCRCRVATPRRGRPGLPGLHLHEPRDRRGHRSGARNGRPPEDCADSARAGPWRPWPAASRC
jgi:hypothetical protein